MACAKFYWLAYKPYKRFMQFANIFPYATRSNAHMVWLNVLTKKRYDALHEVYGSLEEALQHIDQKLLKELGCRYETVLIVLNRFEEFDHESYEKELSKRDLHLISIEDDQYPSLLHQLPDPPVFLYYRGDLEILHEPCIALVGTRGMTPYGRTLRTGACFCRSGDY